MKAAVTNKDLEYGEVDDLIEEDFRDENVKVRITMYVDRDLIKHFRAQAARIGEKYQTLINRAIRESVYRAKNWEDRLKAVEEKLASTQEQKLVAAIGVKRPKKQKSAIIHRRMSKSGTKRQAR